ncbi:MAG TPA: hypothetical protein VMS41_06880 [Gaiellaceae bacterium]|nr:hypothetical protein [Gaiellaceae bacterium]
MARANRLFPRKIGPLGVALTAYDIWRRIPPQHRRMLVAEARRHGTRVAKAAVERRRRGRH